MQEYSCLDSLDIARKPSGVTGPWLRRGKFQGVLFADFSGVFLASFKLRRSFLLLFSCCSDGLDEVWQYPPYEYDHGTVSFGQVIFFDTERPGQPDLFHVACSKWSRSRGGVDSFLCSLFGHVGGRKMLVLHHLGSISQLSLASLSARTCASFFVARRGRRVSDVIENFWCSDCRTGRRHCAVCLHS